MPGRQFPSVGARASAGDPARTRHPQSLWSRAGRLRPTRGRGSISASGTCGIRSAAPASAASARPYAFLPVEGEDLHQIPVGPVHAGIIEPGHFRFTANGETVVRLEQRLGYVHKGIESLMTGATLDRRRSLPAAPRATARSPMPIAFAHAVEAALQIEVPPRARLSARADGRARAARQSFRRYRRHLQRRLLLHDACAMRHPARAHAARGGRLLRPSADDGPRRPRRRRRDLAPDGERRCSALAREIRTGFRG